MTLLLAAFCLAIVVTSLLGGGLPLATALTHTRLQVYLSFAAGAMLGAAFFHMMPQAMLTCPEQRLWWTAAGLLALFFLERFFAFHHHEAPAAAHAPGPPHRHAHDDGDAPGSCGPAVQGGALNWGAAAIGLAAHTLAGGVALASAVATDFDKGHPMKVASWGVFLATVVHKPADALTIVSLMLRAGVPRGLAHLVNLGFALMLPVGVLLFFAGLHGMESGQAAAVTADALAFSAGTFLCIALSDLLPELQFHAHDRWKLSLALLAGVGLMAAATWWE